MTVFAKILAIGMVGLLGLLGLGGAAAYTGASTRAANDQVDNLERARDALQSLQYDNADVSGWQAFYAFDTRLSGPREAVSPEADNRKGFEESAARTRQHLKDMPVGLFDDAEKAQWAKVNQGWAQFFAADAEAVKAYSAATKESIAKADDLINDDETPGTAASAYTIIDDATNAIVSSLDRRADAARAEAASAQQRMTVAVVVALVVLPLLLLLTLWWTAHGIRRSVAGLRTGAEALGRGDFSTSVPCETNDELGDMAVLLESARVSIGELVREVRSAAGDVAGASERLNDTAGALDRFSVTTAGEVDAVVDETGTLAERVRTVSEGNHGLLASIDGVARNAHEASDVASRAVSAAEKTTTTVSRLGESSARIGQVINAITGIAEQTNLLALNATIEAARAGEAGKGFAVVANEVKDLARETSQATEDITERIQSIQADTQAAVAAIAEISSIVVQINETQGLIAQAVAEQTSTMTQMSGDTTSAEQLTSRIAGRIGGIATLSGETKTSANDTLSSAADLARRAEQLRTLVGQFHV